MLTAIDLFAGAGGLSEGFRMENFEILAANDFDKNATNTYKLNHPDVPFLEGPIQDITGKALLKAAKIKKGTLMFLLSALHVKHFLSTTIKGVFMMNDLFYSENISVLLRLLNLKQLLWKMLPG